MTPTELLLAAHDESFLHPWESVTSALVDVTDEMALWQAPGYAHIEEHPDDPRPGTIHGILHHLEHCFHHYALIVHGRKKCDVPAPPPRECSLAERVRGVTAAFHMLRGEMAALTEADLALRFESGTEMGEFLRSVIRHTAWHAGQIAVVKRMYKNHL